MMKSMVRNEKSLEGVAEKFVIEYVRLTGVQPIAVECVGDSKTNYLPPSSTEVNDYLATQRFEVDEAEIVVEDVKTPTTPEQPQPKSEFILIRRTTNGIQVFAGFRRKDHTPLWSTTLRCAHIFNDEKEIVQTAFDSELHLKPGFENVKVVSCSPAAIAAGSSLTPTNSKLVGPLSPRRIL
jgi:hypothetical protein